MSHTGYFQIEKHLDVQTQVNEIAKRFCIIADKRRLVENRMGLDYTFTDVVTTTKLLIPDHIRTKLQDGRRAGTVVYQWGRMLRNPSTQVIFFEDGVVVMTPDMAQKTAEERRPMHPFYEMQRPQHEMVEDMVFIPMNVARLSTLDDLENQVWRHETFLHWIEHDTDLLGKHHLSSIQDKVSRFARNVAHTMQSCRTPRELR